MNLDVLRADALACVAAALAAVEPARLLRKSLERRGASLTLRRAPTDAAARHAGPVVVVGAGKAGLAMARAAAEVAGEDCLGGLVIVPHAGAGACPGGVEVATAAHPLPDAAGLAATARLLAAVAAADGRTLVLAVLSGGASSLLVAPAPGLTLADKVAVTARLLESGADIAAVNALRKHCSLVKGGGLVRAARASAVWALVLSDVLGDDPATIASGPTVADPTTFADAAGILARHLPPDAVPPAIRARIESGSAGRVAETPKPGDAAFARANTVVIGGNRDAVDAAAAAAAGRGYETLVVAEPVRGDAVEAARSLVARLRAAPRDRPVAVVAGGETTVKVRPGGRGGRSQQLALAAAVALAGEPAVVLAAGTDGVDGPTDAAGACVDGRTVERALLRGLAPERALDATDSYPLLAATGDLVRTGPTGTNVADVVVALRAAC